MGPDRLTQVFDDQALAYDRFRPAYPTAILDSFMELTGLKAGDSLLEFGCGTGQLTLDLLKRGVNVLAIEKGAKLAEVAQKNFEDYPSARVVTAKFEDWQPEEKFDSFVAAQAFHWVDKQVGLDKVFELLKETGTMGLIWNVDISQETEFWKKTQPVYNTFLPSSSPKGREKHAVDEFEDYVSSREDFGPVQRVEHKWEKTFDKESFLGLLSTFSNHMVLAPDHRKAFFERIGTLIDAQGGQVERYYKTVLLFSRKLLA
ncbi:MAG: class I SAM-dependent methyltransferase [Bacteroidota bacterium]